MAIRTSAVNCVHTPVLSAATASGSDHSNNQKPNEQQATKCSHYYRQEGLQVLNGEWHRHEVSLFLGILQRVNGHSSGLAVPFLVEGKHLDAVLHPRLQFVDVEVG